MSTAEDLSTESPAHARLSRDSIAELIEGIRDAHQGAGHSWNVVEALEILIDAGQFVLARQLSRSIQSLLRDDARSRLFVAYEALCGIVVDGVLSEHLRQIEMLYEEIFTLGHSHADRVRVSLVRARALGLGVAMKALDESELFTARSVLEQEYHATEEEGKPELALLVGLELVKTYIFAPCQEISAAAGIIDRLTDLAGRSNASGDMLCDLARFKYHVEAVRSTNQHPTFSISWLREAVHGYGGIARALAELSIARVAGPRLDREALEASLEVFEENGHCAAACESALLLAGESAARQHHARAQRFFSRALAGASQGGSCYVSLLALLGLFQSAWASGSTGEAKVVLGQALRLVKSELGITAFGLNVVAALQLTGQFDAAHRTARKCLAAFKALGSSVHEEQALFMIAGCLSGKGDWKGAATCYKRAAVLADRHRDPLAACERKLLRVQALLMQIGDRVATLPALESRLLINDLLEIERTLARLGRSDEVVGHRARLEQLKAQVLLGARDLVAGVKHLSAARELYAESGRARDVALCDAGLGVALIELAKAQGTVMFDEATGALQRALEFFESVKCHHLTWKIRFYLSSAALVRASHDGDSGRRLMWREVALSWFNAASHDRQVIEQSQDVVTEGGWANEFAPHLSFDDLDGLKKAFRSTRAQAGPKAVKETGKTRNSRFRGQLH